MTGGNMYEWVGYTWNPLAGECPHDCEYCYVKSVARRFAHLRSKYAGPVRLDENALSQRLPKHRLIFVCSMNDLFAESVPDEYIRRILEHVQEQSAERKFLFQSKNPARFKDWLDYFPRGSVFATTIESNRALARTNAPAPSERYEAFREFKRLALERSKSYMFEVTIEPVLDFDGAVLFRWLLDLNPDFISIGADSKFNHLPEPSSDKLYMLIEELKREGFSVHLKKNLRRLVPRLFEGDSK